MKLNQLRYFQAVCRYGSVTKAAGALHISQPSISASIKELEEEFGVNLFHRIGKKFYLTKEGEHLLQGVGELLESADRLAETMKDMGNKKNQIKIGVPPMIGSFLFPSIFRSFQAAYPHIRLDISELSSRETCQQVADEELDIALAILAEADHLIFKTLTILTTELCYCVHKNHRLAGEKSVSILEVGDDPIAMLKEGSYHLDAVNRQFAQANLEPNVIMRSIQLETIKRLIQDGTASSFMFREMAQGEPDIVAISLSQPVPIEIGLVWKKNRYMYSDTSKFIDFIENLIRQKDQRTHPLLSL